MISWGGLAGTLVTDRYSAYDAQGAKAKQKCLSHLARTRDWQKLTAVGLGGLSLLRNQSGSG